MKTITLRRDVLKYGVIFVYWQIEEFSRSIFLLEKKFNFSSQDIEISLTINPAFYSQF